MSTGSIAHAEPLEIRRLLSAGRGSGNLIFIDGTESADAIVVTGLAGGGADVFVNGSLTHFPAAQLANTFIVVRAGGGDDAVTVNAPVPTRMTVSGGAGADALTINGTDGSDELDLGLNHSVITGVVVEHEDVERYRLNGGGAIDGFLIFQTNPNIEITIDGQGGDDDITLSTGFDNAGLAGDAHLIGGAGDDRIHVAQSGTGIDNLYTVTPSRITGVGPAACTYEQVERVRLQAGVGADVIRVTPSATTSVTVEGGGFTPNAPADTLELLPGGATGVTLVTTTPTSGRYTFADRMDVNFSSIESLPPPDTEFPQVSGANFLFETAPHAIAVVFSEPVAASLDAGDLHVTNLSTGQSVVPASVAYDAASNTATFLLAGVLPDARFRATIAPADVTDAGGNPLEAELRLEFFFLAADANGDGRVNLSDFNILAANFGQPNRTFSQGDFNYDGLVNLDDFNVLASKFGTVLAGPATTTAVPLGFGTTIDGADDEEGTLDELT